MSVQQLSSQIDTLPNQDTLTEARGDQPSLVAQASIKLTARALTVLGVSRFESGNNGFVDGELKRETFDA